MNKLMIVLLAVVLNPLCPVRAQIEPESPNTGQSNLLEGSAWPVDNVTRLTTSSNIYLSNLDSQIAALEQVLLQRNDGILRARLALAKYHRFQILARLQDAEQALQLLQETPPEHNSYHVDLALVQVHMGFHQFEEARQALMAAKHRGAPPDSLAEAQRALDRSVGKNLETQAEHSNTAESSTTLIQLVTRAAELVEKGDSEQASRLLKAAQDDYQDTSPYVLAWIHTQQGIIHLREKNYSEARRFFAAAHERFPQYVLPAEHLAETELALGNYASALELYSAVVNQTAHPEYLQRLAEAERALGDESAAKIHEKQAGEGYADWVHRYPLMYADHAAKYYLEIGETETALELATRNSASRTDVSARMLLLQTQLAAGELGKACSGTLALKAMGFSPPELQHIESVLEPECAL